MTMRSPWLAPRLWGSDAIAAQRVVNDHSEVPVIDVAKYSMMSSVGEQR